MCFNAESSLLAWIVSYVIGWYLFNRNKNYDRWNAGFILCFSVIQLLEAGLWGTIGSEGSVNTKSINEWLTKLILISLLLQPLLQSYLGWKFTGEVILAMMSFIFLGILLWGFWRIWRSQPGQFSTIKGPNGHLVWRDSQSSSFLGPTAIGLAYLGGLFIPLLFMEGGKGIPLITVGFITAIYSLFFAGPGEFGSYWCFFAVAYGIAALFV